MDRILNSNLKILEGRISQESLLALRDASMPELELGGTPESPLFSIRRNGAEIQMQSRRDPIGEAERIAGAWLEEDKAEIASCIVICGACGLHHINASAGKLKYGTSIFVVEANPGILRKTLEHCSLKFLADSGIRFGFSCSSDRKTLVKDLKDFLAANYIEKVYIHTQPSIKRLMPEQSAEVQKLLEKASDLYKTDLITSLRTSGMNFNNFLTNLPSILKSPGVSALKNIFKGRCGLVTGAGPSLTESLDIIKENRDKFIIFACGTSLKTLFKADIIPDIAVSTDSDPKVFKQFENLESGKMPLAASIFSSPDLVKLYSERIFFFTTATQTQSADWLLKATSYRHGELISAGTVAVSAIDLASQCGCDEIILCGIDLSFTDNGTTHATDSIYDGQKENASQLFHVKGKHGRQVLTNMQFAQYIEIMSEYIEDKYSGSGTKILNVGNSGAYIRGTEEMNLEDFKSMIQNRNGSTAKSRIDKSFRDSCLHPENPELTLKSLDAEFMKIEKAAASISDALMKTLQQKSSPSTEKHLQNDERNLKSSAALPLLSGILLPTLMQMEKDMAACRGNTAKTLEKSIKMYEHIEDAASAAHRQLAAVHKM